jgi:diamine N-acetyltransferase
MPRFQHPTRTEVRMPTLRRAQPGDAKSLAVLAERTFREAFAAVNTPENMDLHCRNTYGEALQAQEIADPDKVTLLSEVGGTLVGYAQVRWGKTPPFVVARAPGEIQRLYVSSECHGTGVARELMEACLREIVARGCDVVWLGVWEHNPRAIAFYRKIGFVEVGEHIFPLGNDPQRDVVMARPIVA